MTDSICFYFESIYRNKDKPKATSASKFICQQTPKYNKGFNKIAKIWQHQSKEGIKAALKKKETAKENGKENKEEVEEKVNDWTKELTGEEEKFNWQRKIEYPARKNQRLTITPGKGICFGGRRSTIGGRNIGIKRTANFILSYERDVVRIWEWRV